MQEQVGFKTDRCRADYFNCCESLRFIIDHFISLSNGLGVCPVITRISEPFDGEVSQTHMDGRACDFRNEIGVGGIHLYTPEQIYSIMTDMNKRFPRDDMKLTCIHHAANTRYGRGPMHYHVQLLAKYKNDYALFCKEYGVSPKDTTKDA